MHTGDSGSWHLDVGGQRALDRDDGGSMLRAGPVERKKQGPLQIDYERPGCVLAHVDNMTFCAWTTKPTGEDVAAFVRMATELTARYPMCSNLTLVLSGTQLPDGEAKAALESLTADFAPFIHSVGLVVDGAGFWSSMIRSFLTGLHLLRNNGYRSKTFSTPEDAYPWLLPAHNADTGCVIDRDAMRAATDAVIARLRQH